MNRHSKLKPKSLGYWYNTSIANRFQIEGLKPNTDKNGSNKGFPTNVLKLYILKYSMNNSGKPLK